VCAVCGWRCGMNVWLENYHANLYCCNLFRVLRIGLYLGWGYVPVFGLLLFVSCICSVSIWCTCIFQYTLIVCFGPRATCTPYFINVGNMVFLVYRPYFNISISNVRGSILEWMRLCSGCLYSMLMRTAHGSYVVVSVCVNHRGRCGPSRLAWGIKREFLLLLCVLCVTCWAVPCDWVLFRVV
jgi:hypothetical protein